MLAPRNAKRESHQARSAGRLTKKRRSKGGAARALDAPGLGALGDDAGGERQRRDRARPDAWGGWRRANAWGGWSDQRECVEGRGMQAGQTPQTLNLAREPVLAKILCKHRQKNRGENRRRQKNGVASPKNASVDQRRADGRQGCQQQNHPHPSPREAPPAVAQGGGSRDRDWLWLTHDENIVPHVLRNSQATPENLRETSQICTLCEVGCAEHSFTQTTLKGNGGGVHLRRFAQIWGN